MGLTLTARARKGLPMWSVLFLALFLGEKSGAAPDPATNLIIDKAKIDMQDSSSGPEKSQIKDQKNRALLPERESDHLRRIKSPKAKAGGRGDYAEDYDEAGCTCFWYPRCSWCRVTRFGQYGQYGPPPPP